MPIVDKLVRRYADNKPLAGHTALLIQHQLGNHVPQAKALIELGLNPRDIYWLDIPYTSHGQVRAALQRMNVPKKNFTVGKYRLLDFYAPHQRLKVQKAIRRLLENPPDRLLVLDDGSHFLEAATAFAGFNERLGSVAIVEQTTRGLIRMNSNAALYRIAQTMPVVNVAGSKPKNILEPVFIAHAVCSALAKRFRRLKNITSDCRCLILGYGSIGKSVARFLSTELGISKSKIYVYDPGLSRAKIAPFAPWDRSKREPTFDLVIGCSGRASFFLGDHVYLNDGAVLASASSGSVELSRRDMIEQADESRFDDIEILRAGIDLDNVHSDIPIRIVDKRITVLNGGFPINFDGRLNCIPSKYIQPTVAMMVMGAIQAAREKRTGLVGLDGRFCKWLDREFRAILGPEAAILPPSPYN
jgi:S-adenosylhomocysteine hydrolase